MNGLNYYLALFTNLKRAHQNGGAPHKPILLLSILDAVERGYILSERIYITTELLALFRSNWEIWVKTPHTMKFYLPFFHLRSEPFWELVTKPNKCIPLTSRNSVKSLDALIQSVDYALIDRELFSYMANVIDREVLRKVLINRYFREIKMYNYASTHYLDEVAEQILKDSAVQYKRKIDRLREEEGEETFEEEVFIRNNVFKKEIPRIYNHTCCISGFKVQLANSHALIDACHIKPFAQDHDDTIGNGLALCPNLHRAFDKGLIAIDNDYHVIVSSLFAESDSQYSIKQHHNKKIILPHNAQFHPRKEVLEWHRDAVFEKWI